MLIIGIAGGTGSGKTTVVKRITDALAPGEVVVMSQDSYYRDNSGIPLEERKKLNFDHPDSIEFDLLVQHIEELKKGNAIEQPTYSYLTCTRQKETVHLEPRNVVIVEGILALQNQKLRKMMDIKIFVEADDDDQAFTRNPPRYSGTRTLGNRRAGQVGKDPQADAQTVHRAFAPACGHRGA